MLSTCRLLSVPRINPVPALVVLTVPAFRTLWTRHDDLNHHVTRYTKASLYPLLEAAGFTIVSTRYLFHWTCAAKLLIRLREAIFQGRPAPPRIPPEPINQLLFRVTQLEERITRYLPLPFGSSLMIVARHASGPLKGRLE